MTLDRRAFVAAAAAPLLARWLPSGAPVRWWRTASFAINPPSADFLRTLPHIMEVAGVPGVAMAVVQERRIAWQQIVGLADAGTSQPATAESLWPAASLSKPVFAFAALRLVDEGKLDLDKPLKSYVPDHAPADTRGDRVTARHVLSHSSGLRNWRNRLDQPLVPDFEPGSRFQYSGEGYYYLQRAVEHITGMGFEQFMEDRLFTTLAMKSSTYSWRPDVDARLVTGHDQGQPRPNMTKDFAGRLLRYADEKQKPLSRFTHEDMLIALQSITPAPAALPNGMIPNAAATLLTNPADYGAFLVELLNGGVASVDLRPATRQAMTSLQTRINSALAWGLGWGLEGSMGSASFTPSYLWHWGDNGSWKNFVLVHPESRSAVVVFTNGSRGLNVARAIVTAAAGREQEAFWWL